MKALIFVSILWAFSFGLIKGQLTDIDPSLVAAIRLLLCTIVFLPFIKLSTDNKLSIKLLGLGALQFGVMYWAYIKSYQYLPAYLVAVLTIFTPIYVYILSCIIEKRISVNILAGVLLSIAGAGIIVFKAPESSQWLIGFVILQLANISFAIGQVGYKYLTDHQPFNHTNNMAIMYIGAAIFSVIVVLANQSYLDVPSISQQQWLVLLYLGMIASGVGFALWNFGATQTTPQALAVMNNGYIPFAVIFSLTLFGEQADIPRLVAGSALMVISLIWLSKSSKQNN